MFIYDENNAGYEPITAGFYEVYANTYFVTTSQAGNEMIQFNYFVRNDVNQKGQGSEIRYDNFTDTPPAHWRWNALTKAVGGIQQGTQMTNEQWAEAMLLKPLKVKVEMEENGNGKEYPRVKAFYKSDQPQFVIQPKRAEAYKSQSKGVGGVDPTTQLSDDNLPF